MNQTPIMQLNAAHRGALKQHFLKLEGADLRLRFGHAVRPEWLGKYTDAIDFERDAVFGVFADNLELAGVAHLALHDETAEFGVSVLPAHRGKGIGKALFKRAAAFARNHLVKTFFMHYLMENKAMIHIALGSGMRIVRDADGTNAYLQLPMTDPASLVDELFATRVALFDFALKSQLALIRIFFSAFTYGFGAKSNNASDRK